MPEVLERDGGISYDDAPKLGRLLSRRPSRVDEVACPLQDPDLLELDQRVAVHGAAGTQHQAATRPHPLFLHDALARLALPAAREPAHLADSRRGLSGSGRPESENQTQHYEQAPQISSH